MKGDAWEAGHRMPFIARWPGKIAAGSKSDQTICFTDMMATFASASGKPLAAGVGEDSYDLLPLLTGLVSGWTGSLRAGLGVPLAGAVVMGCLGLAGWRSESAWSRQQP